MPWQCNKTQIILLTWWVILGLWFIAFMSPCSHQLYVLLVTCAHCYEWTNTFVQSSVCSLLLLVRRAAVDFIFQHSQEEASGRGRNKEWHLFLLAYPKTAIVPVTMVWGYWCRQGCEAVARTPGLHGVVGTGNQPTLFLQTAPLNTNGFWFPGFEVQTA